jgi:hypothetical protein
VLLAWPGDSVHGSARRAFGTSAVALHCLRARTLLLSDDRVRHLALPSRAGCLTARAARPHVNVAAARGGRRRSCDAPPLSRSIPSACSAWSALALREGVSSHHSRCSVCCSTCSMAGSVMDANKLQRVRAMAADVCSSASRPRCCPALPTICGACRVRLRDGCARSMDSQRVRRLG